MSRPVTAPVTAIDTNLLFYAIHAGAPEYAQAREFLDRLAQSSDVLISELVLAELYALLRSGAVVRQPLSAEGACQRIESLRRHPRWRLVDHEPDVMDEVWRRAREPGFARTRIFDVRLGLGLVRRGATELATRNVKHFDGLGFERVWDPLAADA